MIKRRISVLAATPVVLAGLLVCVLLGAGPTTQPGTSGPAAKKSVEPAERTIPVTVQVTPAKESYMVGEPIRVTAQIRNGLSRSISFPMFSLVPNEWNGETLSWSLVDVYRDGRKFNLFLARPLVTPPDNISGSGIRQIAPGKTLDVTLDLAKWKLRDGWEPGSYEAILRADRLHVEPGTELSMTSEPFVFVVVASEPPATQPATQPASGAATQPGAEVSQELAIQIAAALLEQKKVDLSRHLYSGTTQHQGPDGRKFWAVLYVLKDQHVDGGQFYVHVACDTGKASIIYGR